MRQLSAGAKKDAAEEDGERSGGVRIGREGDERKNPFPVLFRPGVAGPSSVCDLT
jgi:hypothetical protein